MVLDGVSLDDRLVRELTAILERPLGEKLERALFFSAEIVALTHGERLAVLAALDRAPSKFEEVRELFSAGGQVEVEAKERVSPIPAGSLDASEGWRLDRESEALAHADVRLLASQELTSKQIEIFDLQEVCESPIEMPLVLALIVVARHEGISVKLVINNREYGDRFEPVLNSRFPDFLLRIEPQAQLGDDRVDFFLSLDGTLRTEDGSVRSASQRMVVECDCGDFHERTKEQARLDRDRDRLLQSVGTLVFRYTGQEIRQDVFACANQALESLVEPVMAQISRTPPRDG